MKKLILVLGLLFVSALCLEAQSVSVDKFKAKLAHKLYKEKVYSKSLELYLELDSVANGSIEEFQYYIALNYLKLREDRTKAIPYLENTKSYFYEIGLEEDYYYLLATAYHLDYRFDEAVMSYDKFLQLSSKRDKRTKVVQRSIDMCMDAKALVAKPAQVDIQNLGNVVNSKYSENTPVISADESVIIFNSNREGSTGGKMNQFGELDSVYGYYFDDIYVSIAINDNWLKPVKIGGGLNTPQHDDVVSLSPDGQRLFIYRSDSMLYGNIFYCDLMGYSWGPLRKLPAPINTKYWENSGSITADGKTFFFSSNRPGGTGDGDFDIYMVRQLPDGSWAEAQNLGTMINTKYDEYSPFIHPDGKTLYFSSKGHNSMGGYDIFKTTLQNGEWTVPVNLGHPVNTPDDDVDFVLSGDGKRGYYSSAHPGGEGEKDLYVINFISEYKDVSPGPVTMLKGMINSCSGASIETASLSVSDNITGELMGIYRPNTATGKYMVIIPKGVDYRISVDADGFESTEFNIVTRKNELFKQENKNVVLCSSSQNCGDKCDKGSYVEGGDGKESIAVDNGLIADESDSKKSDDKKTTANSDVFTMMMNEDISINVWSNDKAINGKLKLDDIIITDGVKNGDLTFDGSIKEFYYQPNKGFSGVDEFEYMICATNGACDNAIAKIYVNDPNNPNPESALARNDERSITKSSSSDHSSYGNKKPLKIELDKEFTLYNIYFNYSESSIRKDSEGSLESIVDFMSGRDDLSITITAHTDSRGTQPYNLDLSKKRANVVKQYLMKNGVKSKQIKAIGKGEDDPINVCERDFDCNEKEHQLNRRMVFLIKGDGIRIESVQPEVVKVNPRPGSEEYKRIEEKPNTQKEREAYNNLLKLKANIQMSGLVFKVQLAAYDRQIMSNDVIGDMDIKSIEKVSDNLYRYFGNNFSSLEAAHRRVAALGGNCFVVPYLNGRRMTWEALNDLLVK